MAPQTAVALDEETEKVTYTIPSHTITGSVPELLEELDDMIDALRMVRETIEKRAPKPARPPRRTWRSRLLAVLRTRNRPARPPSHSPSGTDW